MLDVIVLIGIIVLGLLAVIFLPAFMLRRAVKQTINILKKANALSPENARPLKELGLEQKNFLQRIGRIRDYKPMAVQTLANMGIVVVTEDSRIYLIESRLNELRIKGIY